MLKKKLFPFCQCLLQIEGRKISIIIADDQQAINYPTPTFTPPDHKGQLPGRKPPAHEKLSGPLDH